VIQPKPLSDEVFITPQPQLDELKSLAQAGFRSVIGNRPDDEDSDQPRWSEIERAAREAGMEARHIPVVPGAIGRDDVARFAAALQELPKPILAFCRSGGRAASLWALAQPGSVSTEDIINRAAAAGCDLSQMRGRLDQR
jgi:uncharacterized protein (TIGR01244 family)